MRTLLPLFALALLASCAGTGPAPQTTPPPTDPVAARWPDIDEEIPFDPTVRKGVLEKPTFVDPPLRYPPYTDGKKKWTKRLM